jgi:hypothetical protein
MSGPGEGKKLIGKANVYIHEKGKSNARITHIDIELDELNKIVKPGEASYVQGKEGGVFIGLKKEMIQRAEGSLSHATLKKLQVERAEKEAKK